MTVHKPRTEFNRAWCVRLYGDGPRLGLYRDSAVQLGSGLFSRDGAHVGDSILENQDSLETVSWSWNHTHSWLRNCPAHLPQAPDDSI